MRLDSLTLYASHGQLATLTAANSTVDETNTDTRQLSGLVLPFGPIGHTSAGPIRASSATRITIPEGDQLRRVKLVDEHQEPPKPIGYMTAARVAPEGLRAGFYVGRTPLGDSALLEASEGVRDGFSVELVDVDITDAGELVSGRLKAVALVTTPAWADARQDGLAASDNTTTTGRNTMLTEAQRARLNELLANNDRTDAETAELRTLLDLAGGSVSTDDDGTDDDGTDDDSTDDDHQGTQVQASHRQRRGAAQLPGSLPAGQRRGRRRSDLRELYAATARVFSGQSRPELEAALADITNTANIWVAGDEYAGQLWSGLTYVRRFVPLMTPGELTSYKGTGWRWGVKPAVGDYAGDKAAVPSNAPTTVDSSWTAARLAGAHDIDRKFVDFGDDQFIAAYYEAMRESYAMQSDDKARAFIIANATAAGAAGAGTNLFRGAALAAQAVEDNTNGASVDYFLINSADKMNLLDITDANIPAYLETFGVTPDKFQAAAGVPAGTVIAGTKQASRFRELSGSPIRVEALNIANGGVDGGVFGYYATELLAPAGIASATFGV